MAGRGSAPGERRGGRQKGTSFKMQARAACESLGVDPFQYQALVVKGDVPCNVCRQRGVTRVKASIHVKEHNRNCQSCKGDGWEKLSPETRLKAAESLCKYLEPQLQAVALSGSIGTPDLAVILRERFSRRNGE